jgi:major intracellular serine protease
MRDIQVKLFNHEVHSNNSLNEYVNSQNGYIPSNISMINPFILWNRGITGKDIKIAVIDTGCTSHPDLDNNIIGGRNFTTEDKGKSDIYNDYSGHGTHVAGSICANGKLKGVAPDAKLLILKVLEGNGNGNMESVINAINYAIAQKVDIINMSLGCSVDIPELQNAIRNAINKNIVVVSASGNNGDGNANTNEIDYPSGYEQVISVGAMDNTRLTANFTNSNSFVDLLAPGVNIISTSNDKGYTMMDGTSMASPHVAGVMALLKQWGRIEFGRDLSVMELYAQLIKNTMELNGVSRKIQGNGMLFLK